MKKEVALSYSRIACYKQCPQKFDYEHISKKVVWKETPATKLGREIHTELEEYAKDGKGLNLAIGSKPYIDKILSFKGKKFYEHHLALNSDFEETGFFDDDVLMRFILDVAIVNEDTAQVIDYKTGKRNTSANMEMDFFAFALFCVHPEIKKIKTSLLWLKTNEIDSKVYTRDDIPRVRAEIEKYKGLINDDIKTGSFKAKPSPLCGWCGAVEFCDRK